MHSRVEKSLADGTAFRKLRDNVGDGLTELGFWGTEPSLTLPIISEKLGRLKEMFPNLHTISFSTSLLQPERVIDFIRQANGLFNIKVQVSVDGQFSDINRAPGTAQRIIDNSRLMAGELKEYGNYLIRWKSTLTEGNIRSMVENPDMMDDYEAFFTRLMAGMKEENINARVTPGTHIPTLMVPGQYTSLTGKIFATFLKLYHERGYRTAYTYRLKRVLDYSGEIRKRCMFSCSGGDSNCGIAENMHICHRSFYYDIPEYIESLSGFDAGNWDVSNLSNGNIETLNRYFIVKQPEDKARWNYVMRGYHDYWRLQVTSTIAMVRMLARAGQAEARFLTDNEYSRLFGYFINTALSCPTEGILNTGSMHVMPVSMIRMFGNGAYGELVHDLSR